MKRFGFILMGVMMVMLFFSGCKNSKSDNMNEEKSKLILFLHHSTGKTIWQGGNDFVTKVKGKIGLEGAVEKWFRRYNLQNGTNYRITERAFPKKEPYGWNNYPFDYYNIWVKHGDQDYYMEEPTLKKLAPENDLIIFKHCFPASKIVFDGTPSIDSEQKMVENYKMQYQALKEEMHKYPDTRFLVWTPPALTKSVTNEKSARAANEFSKWVVNEWDQPGDNIFIWDFRSLETKGDIYLLPENSVDIKDSHPSHSFAKRIYPLFCERIVEVLEK